MIAELCNQWDNATPTITDFEPKYVVDLMYVWLDRENFGKRYLTSYGRLNMWFHRTVNRLHIYIYRLRIRDHTMPCILHAYQIPFQAWKILFRIQVKTMIA